MPRKPRIEFYGALYHVIARGNQRRKVFFEADDYEDYLTRLWRYHDKFDFVLYCYCLMPNHVHLLIEAKDVPLSKIMQALQFSYTQSFNRRHRKVGHLFQGRYKPILCDKDEYLLALISYIHNNPVRSGLVKNPKEYKWSSHCSILGKVKKTMCDTKEVLKYFGSTRLYESFVLDNVGLKHKEEYYQLKDQRILGEEEFVEEVIIKKEQDDIKRFYEISLSEIVHAVSDEFDIPENEIYSLSHGRRGSFGRDTVAYLVKRLNRMTMKKVGEYFGRSAVGMAQRYRIMEQRVFGDKALDKRIDKLINKLKKGKRLFTEQNLLSMA